MLNKMKFNDLFDFIENNWLYRDRNNKWSLVELFAEKNSFDKNKIISILESFGAYNDQEVVLNIYDRIPGEFVIGEKLQTPKEFAENNNLYCRWKDGEWVICNKNDEGAMPDLNRAHIMMVKVQN